MSIIFFVVGGLIVFHFIKLIINRHRLSKRIPCSPVAFYNVFGNTDEALFHKDISNLNSAILKLATYYGNIFREGKLSVFWLSYIPIYIFSNAEAVEQLISSTKTMKKAAFYEFLHPWLGTGLLTSYGKKWKSRRKLLTHAFHFDILKDFLPVFNEQSQNLVKILKVEATKEYTDIIMPVTLCSLDIICETTLGVNIKAQENKDSAYVKAVTRATNAIMERMFNFLLWPNALYSLTPAGRNHRKDLILLHNFTRTVIKQKKTILLSGDPDASVKKKRRALMDLLLDQHVQSKDLTDEDVREEIDTFAFEGHDTTSMGISWALYLIGLYQDVQKKLHEEVDGIFGNDTEKHITTDDLRESDYLDRVLKESLRLYPSVPFIARETTEDQYICGYEVPKGSQCLVLTYSLHRDEKYFLDPENFDPDRFLPENSINRHPYAYIPFSAGPRNCIGQRFAVIEMKIVISHILRNFTLEALDSRDKILPAAELILRSDQPLKIKLRPRRLTYNE